MVLDRWGLTSETILNSIIQILIDHFVDFGHLLILPLFLHYYWSPIFMRKSDQI